MDTNSKLNLEDILREDEKILFFSPSKRGLSLYVIIVKNNNRYITFRISNHQTNSFYSNPTFNSNMKSELMLSRIRTYMDESNWYNFRYEEYFTLNILNSLPYNNLRIYIDNTMDIFEHSKMGIVFYQSRHFGRNHKEFNVVSESFQKYLRRLFALGLINGYKQDNGEILIYITSMGRAMCEYMDEKYKSKFKIDKEQVNLRYIEVPDME